MALPGKKKLYLPLLIIGIICVAVALYLLGEYMGQVKLREEQHFTDRSGETNSTSNSYIIKNPRIELVDGGSM